MNKWHCDTVCLSGFNIHGRGENFKQPTSECFQTFNCITQHSTTLSGISITGKNSGKLYIFLNLSIPVYTLSQTCFFMVPVPTAGWGKLHRGQKERLLYWDTPSLGCSSNLHFCHALSQESGACVCTLSGHSLCRAADQPPNSSPKSHIPTVEDAR